MSAARDLLLEIGTEELPPKALLTLSEAFGAGLLDGLSKAGLSHGAMHSYATPRRLAVHIENLSTAQPDQVQERRGPALAACFDAAGKPTQAALGFARSCGVAIEQLERQETDKGAWLVYRHTQAGKPTVELLQALIEDALAKLPIPKRMRWADLDVSFVRPVHWVLLLFGADVVDTTVMGLRAGRITYGHRFHHPDAISIQQAADYHGALQNPGHVVADFAVRRAAIRAQVEAAAGKAGGQAVIDPALLDEVTSLVEWPVALLGRFEERFLQVPQEALISTMKGNQKYFHVVDGAGHLLPYFITLCNIDSRDPAQVIAGNERVIRPRFADAAFFWEQDRKQPLAALREGLKSVVYQQKLGTQFDKSLRVAALARVIAKAIGADQVRAERAAALAKCDLLSHMVGEFPELQGVMGRYCAQHDGEDAEVALAIDEHYLPRYAGDALPNTPTGQALALADKLDTLAGIFAIGMKPTGDKDPYGLRRAALGTVRILIERHLALDLEDLLSHAVTAIPIVNSEEQEEETVAAVFDYVMERLRAYFQDSGVSADEFDAVLATRPVSPYDFEQRVRAVTAFRRLPEAESLTAANKRIRNILKQVDGAVPEQITPQLFAEPAESQLYARLTALLAEVAPLLDAGNYRSALERLAGLRQPVDQFFDSVMVMSEDTAQRDNRLALLNTMSQLFLRVADLSRLQQ
jgi:glycyl-tRNA synthetase beta chain